MDGHDKRLVKLSHLTASVEWHDSAGLDDCTFS